MDKNFSSNEFERLGRNSPAARELADQLEDYVAIEIDKVARVRFESLVEELRDLGHNLTQDAPDRIGEISYRDESDVDGYVCKLRLSYDAVVSAGYAHLISPDELDLGDTSE